MEFSQPESKRAALDPQSDQKERRAFPRLNCKGTAEMLILPDGPKVVGSVSNLSLGGCCIESEIILSAKLQTSVEVRLTVDDNRLRLPGAICHIEDETWVGVRFTEVSSRKAEQIKYLMAELFEKEKQRLEEAKAAAARKDLERD
jgi:c-di-GMP-binding flagellar brake protein YcgR